MRVRVVVLSTVVAAAAVIGPAGAAATTRYVSAQSGERPTVTRLHVTGRTAHTLSFAARVNPNGLATKASLLAKYGRRTVGGATRSAGAGTTAKTLNFTITHLHAHRTFHVHVSATNSAGTTTSSVIAATTKRKH